ncbi:MAG TPA: hypothetical protein VFF69_01360 [Phycisphaerales bacterium]|nr:hypothetical protein [Phycisphaerales bacterium]
MVKLHDGQCGLCTHFGEHEPGEDRRLVQIRVSGEAPDDLLEPCGLPQHEQLHLMVTPSSGCAGFEPASV